MTQLSEELDATFTTWLASVKEGKEKCMVCMGILVAGEEIAACEHCGNVAHKEHLQEWLRQKGVCPVCKEQLNEENITIKGKKK